MKKIVLFDGDCPFCHRSVQFIIKRDPHKRFEFAPLQSDIGQALLKQFNINNDINSIVLIDRNKAHTHSTAALRICKSLHGFWKMFSLFLFMPKLVRDFFYKQIAKSRYKLFSQQYCSLPTKEQTERFL